MPKITTLNDFMSISWYNITRQSNVRKDNSHDPQTNNQLKWTNFFI